MKYHFSIDYSLYHLLPGLCFLSLQIFLYQVAQLLHVFLDYNNKS